jgi:hypothetical protein
MLICSPLSTYLAIALAAFGPNTRNCAPDALAAEYVERDLKDLIQTTTSGRVAGFIAETIQVGAWRRIPSRSR